MYCSYQYLSINPKKSLPRPQTAQKLQINMNADIPYADLDTVALYAAQVSYAMAFLH